MRTPKTKSRAKLNDENLNVRKSFSLLNETNHVEFWYPNKGYSLRENAYEEKITRMKVMSKR